MNFAAIGEMKRIAMLEMRMHESIANNFAQKFPPSDSAHYQHIYCWGRGLSGRARASRTLDANIGTIGSTDDFFVSAEKRKHAFAASEAFIANLGPQSQREKTEYLYHTTPLWEKIAPGTIRSFLESLIPFYPERSRKILRGVMRDISGNEAIEWDVVLGIPSNGQSGMFGGHAIRYGAPNTKPTGQDAVRTQAAFLYMAFYAMIRSEHIWREDWKLLADHRLQVAQAIENRRTLNNGILPKQYGDVLPGDASAPLADRLALLIDNAGANAAKALPDAIHARLGDKEIDISQSYRRRSASDYMARVHKSAAHRRPTLQLYLFWPDGVDDGAKPMISISFYWPEHAPDGFFTVCVDENPDFVRMVTPRVFCQNVEDILKEHDFPMQRKELLCKMLERLGLRCNENFFAQHINTPLDGFKYHKMEGRNAYCINGWAEDEEARLGNELVQAAISILQRENKPIKAEGLLEMVVDEQPKFRDFFSPKSDTSKLNALMTSDVLNANDITVISQKPMTYRYHN